MEFQVQDVYLIYARLIVHIMLNIAYPKDYILYAINIWDNIIVLEPSIFFCDLWQMCDTMSYYMTVCDIMLTLTLSPK